MNAQLNQDAREVLAALHYRPAVSIIMPLEQHESINSDLSHRLKIAADEAERELRNNYPSEICDLISGKMTRILAGINVHSHKKSIAIYVSVVFEKVIWLDTPAEQKIIVDDSFEIRDLVYDQKQMHKCLILLLSGKESKILLMNSSKFLRIMPQVPELVYAYINDSPERTGNFSDMNRHKEILTEKFLEHIDGALTDVLKAHPLPMFVIGAEKIVGHFKKLTRHANAIAGYVHGNYEEADFAALREALRPSIAQFNENKKNLLLNQLEEEAGQEKLVKGMVAVWSAVQAHNARLLVVEKNYVHPAQHGPAADVIEELTEPVNHLAYIRDAVDDIIEKVIEQGGEVEFVDDNDLNKFDHIALVKYYS